MVNILFMGYRTLAECVSDLERHKHLVRVDTEVDARLEVAEIQRKRGPLVVETYTLSLLSGRKGDVFDRAPPPELLR